ncbi:hypothetical protein QWI17_13690 [Gilvimarinus sp. SDUM040013]|uniref:5-methyltetrahydrofolate--homocysteine methyltransferase n=1 Tax=Gilvimarinus gilvus TaxID=3058038 RepID=A0ABU4S2C8_9GAMM|nr:hypothetical protein [Gilvimarinus sp. SDUM040013]MDO3386894.1 hypothetical protein [Gilvimarinus sp. SDUM040013]MDX6851339.1 hypothetical protein [Gilvimarinus sp. SDUM040013]
MLLEKNVKPLSAIILALMLSACGGDSETNIYAQDVAQPGHEDEHDHDHDEHDDEDEHDHDDEHEEGISEARLVLVEAGTELAHVFDIEHVEKVSSLTLPAPIGYAYPVPGYRYAALVHRDDNWVSFIDGGVWVEDHGDHDHPYTEAPAIQDFHLDGVKPTHYTFDDEQVAVFYDGNGETGDVAGVATFDAHSVADNGLANTLSFTTHMHGAAQVRGEHLYTTERNADAASTLPDRVSVYHLHDTEYELEAIFDEPCPALHGSAQNEEHVFFACGDGVLVIEEHDGFEVNKITHGDVLSGDARVGSLRAHHQVHDVIGLASGQLVLIEPHEATLQTLGWESDVGVVAAEFAADGEFFVALLADGSMVVFDVADWSVHGELAATDASGLTDDQSLRMIAGPTGHSVYIVNPALSEVVPVDVEELTLGEHWALDFEPSVGVWLGHGGEAHEHEGHDH